MKRIISILLVVFTALSLFACGAGNTGAPDSSRPGINTSAPDTVEPTGTVVFEKSFKVAEGIDVKLGFIGKDGAVDTITVEVNGVRTSDVSVYSASQKVLGRDEAATSDDPELRFFSEDVNFDGYVDFCIQSWIKDGATPYYCWFWNTLDKTFSFGAELEDPMLDKTNSRIYCDVTDNGKEYLNVYTVLNGAVSLLGSTALDLKPSFSTDLSYYEQYMDPADRDGYLILANKEHSLGEDYVPDDLVDINNTRQDGRATQQMRSTASQALYALYTEMFAAGYTDVSVTSAYRSAEDQRRIFDGFLNDNLAAGYDYDTAMAMVLSDTAYPGTSEHQTGLCCDMHSSASADIARTEFPRTEAYKWLTENAWKFGFILRYPEDKEEITGYTYESWHYRFVGRYHAAKMHAMGLCLEEYLDLINK